MYMCNVCDALFDTPAVETEYFDTAYGYAPYVTESCPVCGESFSAAESCSCGGVKREGDILCSECRNALKARFIAFADELTAEEENQLDEWLEGCSITDRRNFG